MSARELVAIELADMKLVRHAAAVAVFRLVGAGEDQEAVRAQHATDLVDERRLGDDVLDRFERDHRVETRVGERQRRAIRLPEFEIPDRRVARPRVLHGRGRDVGADDAGGARGEERAAVALAAGDVEHIESGDERRGEMVPMPMLVPDLAGGAGDEALAGEFEFLAHWLTFALGAALRAIG